MTLLAKHYIDGQLLQLPPKNQFDIRLLATFEQENVQPNLTIETLELALDGFRIVKEKIEEGRIFDDIRYQITFDESEVFDGRLALFKGCELNNELGTAAVKVEQRFGLNALFDRLAAIDYEFLWDKGVITDDDFIKLTYQVVPIFNLLDQLILTGQLAALTIASIDNAYKLSNAIAVFSGIVAAGITGAVGAAIYAGLHVIALAAYQIALAVQIVKLGKTILDIYLPPNRVARTSSFWQLLEKPLEFLGLTLNSSIEEDLHRFCYLPENIALDSINATGFLQTPGGPKRGYPTIGSFGFSCLEMIELVCKIFNSRIAIQGNVVYLNPLDSPAWQRQSTYVLPNIEPQSFRYNTDQFLAVTTLQFAVDFQDQYTLDNYPKTTAVYIQEPIQGRRNVVNREDIKFGLALGNRKTELSPFENFLTFILSGIDLLALGTTNFANQIKYTLGILKVSSNNWTVPKLIRLNAQEQLLDGFRADYFWETYYKERSFKLNASRQRKIFEGVEVPFSLKDFNQLANNSYFTTSDGKRGKVIKCEWALNSDKATIDYYIEEIYLTEIEDKLIYPTN